MDQAAYSNKGMVSEWVDSVVWTDFTAWQELKHCFEKTSTKTVYPCLCAMNALTNRETQEITSY